MKASCRKHLSCLTDIGLAVVMLVTATFWVKSWSNSYSVTYDFRWGNDTKTLGAVGVGGVLIVYASSWTYLGWRWPLGWHDRIELLSPGDAAVRRSAATGGSDCFPGCALADAGFACSSRNLGDYQDARFVFPIWLIELVLGLLLLKRKWRKWRTWSREGRGLCPTCAYDLRASKDRCPECGTAIERHPESSMTPT